VSSVARPHRLSQALAAARPVALSWFENDLRKLEAYVSTRQASAMARRPSFAVTARVRRRAALSQKASQRSGTWSRFFWFPRSASRLAKRRAELESTATVSTLVALGARGRSENQRSILFDLESSGVPHRAARAASPVRPASTGRRSFHEAAPRGRASASRCAGTGAQAALSPIHPEKRWSTAGGFAAEQRLFYTWKTCLRARSRGGSEHRTNWQ
jgi:hypothetical protein